MLQPPDQLSRYPLSKLQPDLPSFPEEELDKETAKDREIESDESREKPTTTSELNAISDVRTPGLGNQATVEDEIEVEVEVPTPAQTYSPRIQGNIFQKNEMQGMKEALSEDKSSGLEPSVVSSVYAVITAVILHLITHGSTDPLREYALNSTAVIYLLNNTYSVIRHKYARTATRDYT